MTFTEMNELKDMLIKSIAEVLSEKEIPYFQITLEKFHWENIWEEYLNNKKFRILINDKLTNRKIYQIVFNSEDRPNGDILQRYIKIGEVPFGNKGITLTEFTKTAFKTTFSAYLDKNPYKPIFNDDKYLNTKE